MREPTNIGEEIEKMLPVLRELCEKNKAECDMWREQMKGIEQFCLEHEDIQMEVDWERTFGRSHQEGKLVPCFKCCQKCTEIMKAPLVNETWRKMGVPAKNAHATFDNFDCTISPTSQRKVIAKFRQQLNRGDGFILALGKVGTGKSHLAAAALKEGGGGIFVTEADMIGRLRKSYSENTSADDMVEEYRNAKILVVDELSQEVKGTDVAPFLYRVLAHRYDQGKLTIITSNEELDIVLTILGDRIKDRITASYVIANFDWPSYRKT